MVETSEDKQKQDPQTPDTAMPGGTMDMFDSNQKVSPTKFNKNQGSVSINMEESQSPTKVSSKKKNK